MKLKKKIIRNKGIKFGLMEGDQEIGHAYLYILHNDLHKKPFGFLEDVYIDETKQGQGLGGQLIKAIIKEAKHQSCYKLIGTSRHARKKVHQFYEKLGFKHYGIEFRMDL